MRPHVVAAFTLGCGCVLMWPDPLPVWLIMAALPLLYWRPTRWAAMALMLGAGWTEWQVRDRLADRWPAERHAEDVRVEGVIASLPERTDLGGSQNWRFTYAPSADARAEGLPERIRVSWYRTLQSVAAGECWAFTLRLRTPRGSHNPGSFDYEGWLFRERLGATAAVRAAERCETPASGLRAGLLRLRSDWMAAIDEVLDRHPGAPLLAALSVGDGRGLSDAHWRVFRVTGTSHLVVISGLHLAFMSGLGFLLVRLLWPLVPGAALRLPTPWAAGLGAALFATAYALLAGLQTPVMRALLMVWLALLIAWRGGWRQPYQALAWVWAVVVALDPLVLLRPGLWLSFGAVAGILHLTAFRLRTAGWFRLLLTIQLGLGLLLAPLTLVFFDGATLLAPLANLIAVPIFTLLTPAALLSVLLTIAKPEVGVPVLQAVADLLGWAWAGLSGLADAAGGLWLAGAPPPAAGLIALLGVVLIAAPVGLPLKPLGVLCLLPLLFPPLHAPKDGYTVTVLDVGQGLAVVVRTPQHSLLYDAGPAFDGGFDAGATVVLPWLRSQGIRSLDTVVISHADQDHMGGLAAVEAGVPVSRLLGAPARPPCHAGQQWTWDGVHFAFLHPPPETIQQRRPRNDDSCVLRIEGPQGVTLLAGDIERRAEAALLRTQPERLRADLLIAPHHGSRTSSTPGFVAAVHPKAVVFASGWRHHYGHPHPDVVQRYRNINAALWTSGTHGALTIEWTEPGAPRVAAWRLDQRRRWHAAAQP